MDGFICRTQIQISHQFFNDWRFPGNVAQFKKEDIKDKTVQHKWNSGWRGETDVHLSPDVYKLKGNRSSDEGGVIKRRRLYFYILAIKNP